MGAERRLRREVDARVEDARSKASASVAKLHGVDGASNSASILEAEKELKRAQEKLDSLRSKDAAKNKEEKRKKEDSHSTSANSDDAKSESESSQPKKKRKKKRSRSKSKKSQR